MKASLILAALFVVAAPSFAQDAPAQPNRFLTARPTAT